MSRLPPARESDSVADTRVDGRLEGVVNGSVVGWAWSPESPMERIWVTVFVDDEPVGLVAADLKRVDLLAAGLGDGAHGFAVELPARLRDSGQHALRAMAGRSNTQLPAVSWLSAAVDPAERSSNGAHPSHGASSTGAVRLEAADTNGSTAQASIAGPAQASIAGSPATMSIPGGPGQTSIAGPAADATIGGRRSWPPALAPRALLTREALWRYGPQTALAAGVVTNLVLLLVLTRHLSFFQDDYLFILDKRGWSPDTFLAPVYGHLSLMLVATFKLLFAAVGLTDSWPYRLVGITIDTICVVSLYLLLAPRAGRVIALVPAYLLLMLGAGTGSTDLIWITSIGYLLSLAAGVAALVCLTRDDKTGDRAAAGLLVISLASSSPSLAMCAGAAALMLATRAPLRRYWVVLGPLALYCLWYLGYGTQELDISNITKVPEYLLQIGMTTFGALAGLRAPARNDGFGAILFVGAVAAFALHAKRERRLPPLAVAGAVATLTFWILVALTRAQTNNATSLRYAYPSAVFALIALGGLLSWRRLAASWAIPVACLVLLVGLGNLGALSVMVRGRTKLDNEVRAVLGASEMIGPAGSPAFKPNPPFVPYLRLGPYLDAVHQLGSPAFAPAQIERQSPSNRRLADQTIIAGERIALWLPPTLKGAAAPPVEESEAVTLVSASRGGGGCLTATPTAADASIDLTVTPGAALYLALTGEGAVTIYARRLAATYPQQPLGTLPSTDGPRGLGFPLDASRFPWHVQLRPTAPLVVCRGATDTQ